MCRSTFVSPTGPATLDLETTSIRRSSWHRSAPGQASVGWRWRCRASPAARRRGRQAGSGTSAPLRSPSPGTRAATTSGSGSRPGTAPVRPRSRRHCRRRRTGVVARRQPDRLHQQTATGNWDLFVMGADGGDVTQLTDTATHEGNLDWSPDGTRLPSIAGHVRQLRRAHRMPPVAGNAAHDTDRHRRRPQLVTRRHHDRVQKAPAARPSDPEDHRMGWTRDGQTGSPPARTATPSHLVPGWEPDRVPRSRRTSALRIYVMGPGGRAPTPPRSPTATTTPVRPGPRRQLRRPAAPDDGGRRAWLVSRGEFTAHRQHRHHRLAARLAAHPGHRPHRRRRGGGRGVLVRPPRDGPGALLGYGAFGQLGNDATGDQWPPRWR